MTTPLFFGTAVTGPDGRTAVTGRLPDNLTTFKLMAVAMDADDRAGSGESKVLVTKPLLARPALPRAVRAGDRFAAGVVVHAREATDPVDIQVSAEVEGAVQGLEALSRTLTIPPGQGVEIRFAFAAQDPGVALLRFKVTGGGHTDIVEAPLPVRSPTRMETVATYGITEGESVEALAPPGGIRADQGDLSITLAGSALTGLGDAAEYLVEYPYGCLEQQSSRLVPFVALQQLLQQQEVPWLGGRQPAEVVATAIRAVAAMQRPDGGFGYWPDSERSHFWATAWATVAVHAAGAAGYPTAPVQLAKAAEYLKKGLDAPTGLGLEERAFALYTLARIGAPERGHARDLFGQRAGLALFGKALLTSALVAAGEDGRAHTVLDELLNAAQVTPAAVHFAEADGGTHAPLFSSDLRTTAMALQALLAVNPEHVYVGPVVRYLLDARKAGGGYRSTQDAAWALLALADYARLSEPAQPDLQASVDLAGKNLANHHFISAGQPALTTVVPTAELPAGESPLKFKAQGVGRLYYGARLRFAPKVMPTEPADDGLVVQRWYTAADGTERLRAVTEGTMVRVHLRVATHQERFYLAIEDPLPAGLEPVDPGLRTSARARTAPEAEGGGLDGHVDPWFSPFNTVEMRDDRVLLFADHLPPGVYSYSYTARATTAGTFALPPARAEAMYRPEISGRSDGGTFWIHPAAELAHR
ncbi:MAG: alpha-2-macroglobulin family protein [bacterium]